MSHCDDLIADEEGLGLQIFSFVMQAHCTKPPKTNSVTQHNQIASSLGPLLLFQTKSERRKLVLPDKLHLLII